MELKFKMIKKSLSKKISLFLFLILISATSYPLTSHAQTQNPTHFYQNQVETLSGSEPDIEACMTELATNSLIDLLGGSLIEFGLGELLGNATGAMGDIGGAIGGALGIDLGSFGGGGIDLGGLGGFVGGGTVPVNEDALRAINEKITEINAQIQGDTGGLASKEIADGKKSLDGIGFCLANQAMEGILNGTIEWVNSGFNGNPAFVDDPGKFFSDIADYELGEFLNDLSGGILCSNIEASITVNLMSDYNNSGNYRERSRCTLSDVSENIEAFANGDFSKGGWDAWYEYTTNPYNNYYGATLSLRQDFDRRVSKTQSDSYTEISLNNGYYSIRDKETGEITTPGSMVQAQVENRLNAPVNRLTFADEFDELMNSLIGNFISDSVGSLLGN